MIAEEATLIQSTSNCQKELTTQCSELPVEPFQDEGKPTFLQLEEDSPAQVELLQNRTGEPVNEVKLRQEQDQGLREVPACHTLTPTGTPSQLRRAEAVQTTRSNFKGNKGISA